MNPQSPYPTQPTMSPGLPSPYPQPPMKRHRGGGNVTIILMVLLVLFILLFFGALGFGIWAYGERNDYKLHTDQKIEEAVAIAEQKKSDEKDKDFLEKEKNPFRQFKGLSQFGSVDITYPKTWAAYVDQSGKGQTPIDGYFHPNVVPGTGSGTAFALRIQVIEQNYDQVMGGYKSRVTSNKLRATPYTLPKVPQVLGSRLDGEVDKDLNGSAVVLPLRDKTVKITAQSQEFMADFNNIILPNFVFIP